MPMWVLSNCLLMVMCQALIIWQPVIAKTCKYTMHHYHCTVLGTRFAYSNHTPVSDPALWFLAHADMNGYSYIICIQVSRIMLRRVLL